MMMAVASVTTYYITFSCFMDTVTIISCVIFPFLLLVKNLLSISHHLHLQHTPCPLLHGMDSLYLAYENRHRYALLTFHIQVLEVFP